MRRWAAAGVGCGGHCCCDKRGRRRRSLIAVRTLVLVGLIALLAAGCAEAKGTHVEISADLPPAPSAWPRTPTFSPHSCWSRSNANDVTFQVAPSVPALKTVNATPPTELVRRLLARFGDPSFVRGIEIGAPPKLQGVFPKEPPTDALWAYISAPLANQVAPPGITPDEAGQRTLAYWETELIGGALRDDFCRAGNQSLMGWSVSGQVHGISEGALNQRFPNPSPSEFRTRVAAVGKRYGFTATSVRFVRPRELAPIVVVETDRDRKKFVADVAAIVDLLDPRSSSGHRGAVTFEGFFFEARDAKGPFVRVYNAYRGEIMGGQWSADPCAYPYEHGGPVRAKPCPE
jgi:hypothetical protein